MKIPLSLFCLLASTATFAEETQTTTDASEQAIVLQEKKEALNYLPIKDESDLSILSPSLQDRKTAKLKLPNGLSVYLISDPEATQDAAALGVRVGSWNDPKTYPGMAHFLEHMLFQGTKAYPNSSEYMRFIWDHGGCPNAFTANDRTVYMFSINPSSFLEALDRFSHFFIDPLFHPAQIENELFAVDQEFGKNIENDNWRLYQISKETGNPAHPNALFSTGNSKTLRGIPQEEMKKWYETFYSSNLMDLVVYSSLPLETLQEQVVEKFQRIPNRNALAFFSSEPLTSAQQRGHFIYVSPIQKIERLTLQWELPQSLAKDESKSAALIAYAITRGSSKSLLEYLKKEGLAENLSAQSEEIGSLYHLFSIDIDLTDKGVENLTKVIQTTFETLALLKESPLPFYLFDEMKLMREINYRYQEREDPFVFVKNHASQLLDEELSTYPRKTLFPSHYDKERIAQVLTSLSPQECQVYVCADPKLTHVAPQEKEEWLGGEYTIAEISQETLSSWENAHPNPEIQLPLPNAFIPTHLSIVNHSQETKDLPPAKLIDSEMGKVFFNERDPFQTPTVAWDIHMKSPLLDASASSFAHSDLFLNMLEDKLQPLLSNATSAGLDLRLCRNHYRIELSLNGYSEKAPLFLKEVLQSLKNASFSQEDFDRSFVALKRFYENCAHDMPMMQAKELQNSFLSPSNITSAEKAKALQDLSLEKLIEFQKKLTESLYLEVFFAGNMTKSDAASAWSSITETLHFSPFPPSQHLQKQVLLLPSAGKPLELVQTTEALGSGVVLTLGQGDFSFSARSAQQILASALKEAFFTALRSKQKTAYIAKSWEEEIERQLFHSFAVQSSSHDVSDLIHRFEFFIEDFAQNVTTYIPEGRFSALKQDLITQLSNPPKNLQEMLLRKSTLAFDYQEDFQWIEKRTEALKELSYKDFLTFVQTTFSYRNNGRLAVLYQGKLLQEENVSYAPISVEDLLKKSRYITAKGEKEDLPFEEETATEK